MRRDAELENKIRSDVFSFFAEQCGVDVAILSDDTNIIEDIGGDSLMFLQLLEGWKRQYDIDVEFRVIGKYMIKNPVTTIRKTIELALMIVCDKEKFLELASK